MLRLTIATPHNILSVGMVVIPEIFEALGFSSGDSFDAFQIITDDFLDKMRSVKPAGAGFTADYKENFMKCLEKAKGKYCIFTDDWIMDMQSKKAKYLFELASELTKKDASETIESVKNRVTQKYNELSSPEKPLNN